MSGKAGIFILVGIIVAIIVFAFFRKTEINPVTGRKQHVNFTPEEEVGLGMQCAPEMVVEFGGLYPDQKQQDRVKAIGKKLVAASEASKFPYQFDFHVLSDTATKNAFLIPGGQIFVTYGLLKKMSSDDQIAGVLAHEMGHIIGRHATEKLSKYDLLQGISGAEVSKFNSNQLTNYVADLINISFDAENEYEADDLAVRYMIKAGYKPEVWAETIGHLDKIVEKKRFLQYAETHPVFSDRIKEITMDIKKYTPKSVR